MKILVTGATHGLGFNAVTYLKQKGVTVVATGRDTAQGQGLAKRGIEFIPLDLTQLNRSHGQHLFKDVDTIWHCAALSSPWGAYEDFYAINVTASVMLAKLANETGVRSMVHISTPSLYFDFNDRHLVTEFFRPKKQVNHYAATKLIAEEKLAELNETASDFDLLFLRPRAIYGPHDRVLLPRILELLNKYHGKLPLPQQGNVELDMTYVANLLDAMMLATQKLCTSPKTVSGEAYNISNHDPIRLKTLLELVLTEGLNKPFTIKSLPFPLLYTLGKVLEFTSRFTKREPLFTPYTIGTLNYALSLDISKAQRDLDYAPRYTTHQGIIQTLKALHGTHYSL